MLRYKTIACVFEFSTKMVDIKNCSLMVCDFYYCGNILQMFQVAIHPFTLMIEVSPCTM